MKQYCYQCGEYSLNIDSMEAVCIAYSSDAFMFVSYAIMQHCHCGIVFCHFLL